MADLSATIGFKVNLNELKKLERALEESVKAGSGLDGVLDRVRKSGATAFAGASRGARTLERRLTSIGKVARRARLELGTFAGVVAGAFGFQRIIETIADFDRALQVTGAVARATAAEYAALREQSVELGRTTLFTAKQVGEAQGFLARAGFELNEIVSAIPATLNLAIAGQLGIADASDIASKVIRGFNLEAAEAGRLVDIFAATATRSNTSIQQLGQALSFVAPVASALNVSLEDTAAVLGTLGDAGLQADRAGTGLRTVLSSLSAPSKEAQKILAQLGLTAEDVNVSANGLLLVLDRLANSGITVGQSFELFSQRGVPAFQALAVAIRDGEDGLFQFSAALRDAEGEGKRLADRIQDDLRGSITATSSALEGLILGVGEAGLRDVLRGTFDGITETLRSITRNLDQVGAAVQFAFQIGSILLFSRTLTTVSAVLGGILVSLRTFGVGIAGIIAGAGVRTAALATASLTATAGMKALTVAGSRLLAVFGGPVGAALAVASGALLALNLRQTEVEKSTNKLVAAQQDLADATANLDQNNFTTYATALREYEDAAKGAASANRELLAELSKSIDTAAQQEEFRNRVSALRNATPSAVENAREQSQFVSQADLDAIDRAGLSNAQSAGNLIARATQRVGVIQRLAKELVNEERKLADAIRNNESGLLSDNALEFQRKTLDAVVQRKKAADQAFVADFRIANNEVNATLDELRASTELAFASGNNELGTALSSTVESLIVQFRSLQLAQSQVSEEGIASWLEWDAQINAARGSVEEINKELQDFLDSTRDVIENLSTDVRINTALLGIDPEDTREIERAIGLIETVSDVEVAIGVDTGALAGLEDFLREEQEIRLEFKGGELPEAAQQQIDQLRERAEIELDVDIPDQVFELISELLGLQDTVIRTEIQLEIRDDILDFTEDLELANIAESADLLRDRLEASFLPADRLKAIFIENESRLQGQVAELNNIIDRSQKLARENPAAFAELQASGIFDALEREYEKTLSVINEQTKESIRELNREISTIDDVLNDTIDQLIDGEFDPKQFFRNFKKAAVRDLLEGTIGAPLREAVRGAAGEGLFAPFGVGAQKFKTDVDGIIVGLREELADLRANNVVVQIERDLDQFAKDYVLKIKTDLPGLDNSLAFAGGAPSALPQKVEVDVLRGFEGTPNQPSLFTGADKGLRDLSKETKRQTTIFTRFDQTLASIPRVIGDAVQEGSQPAADAITQAATEGFNFDSFGRDLGNTIGLFSPELGVAVNGITGATKSISNLFGSEGVLSGLGNSIGGVAGGIGKAVGGALGPIGSVLGGIGGSIGSLVSTIAPALGPIGAAVGAVLGLVDIFKGLFGRSPRATSLIGNVDQENGGSPTSDFFLRRTDNQKIEQDPTLDGTLNALNEFIDRLENVGGALTRGIAIQTTFRPEDEEFSFSFGDAARGPGAVKRDFQGEAGIEAGVAAILREVALSSSVRGLSDAIVQDFRELKTITLETIDEVLRRAERRFELEGELPSFVLGAAGEVLRQFNELSRRQRDERREITDLGGFSPEALLGFEVKLFNERVKFLSELTNQQRAVLSEVVSATELALSDLFFIINNEQEQVTENLIQTASAFEAAKESIRSFLDEFDFGRFSQLSPLEQLERAEQQFNSTLARARIGDADALGDITRLADRFLGLQRDVFASSTRTQETTTRVLAALDELNALPIPEVVVNPAETPVTGELETIRLLVAKAFDQGAGNLDFEPLRDFLDEATTLDPAFVDRLLTAVSSVETSISPQAFTVVTGAVNQQTSILGGQLAAQSALLAQIAINTGNFSVTGGQIVTNTGNTVAGIAAIFDQQVNSAQTQVNGAAPVVTQSGSSTVTGSPVVAPSSPTFTATNSFSSGGNAGGIGNGQVSLE